MATAWSREASQLQDRDEAALYLGVRFHIDAECRGRSAGRDAATRGAAMKVGSDAHAEENYLGERACRRRAPFS